MRRSGLVPTHGSLVSLLTRLRSDVAADLAVVSDADDALALGRWSFRLPAGTPEWLGPIVSIIVGQLHALHLTRVHGHDPELPRNPQQVDANPLTAPPCAVLPGENYLAAAVAAGRSGMTPS